MLMIVLVIATGTIMCSGNILPDINFICYLAALLFSIICLWLTGCFEDFKKPFTLFSMMYIFFLMIGAIPLHLLGKFNPDVAKVVLAGFWLYILGYLVSIKRVSIPSVSSITGMEETLFDWPYLIYAFLIVSGILGILQFFINAGGIIILDPEMMEHRVEIRSGIGYGIQFFRFMIIPFLLIVARRVSDGSTLFSASTVLLAFVCFFGLIGTGSRSPAAELFLMLLIIYYYGMDRRFRFKHMAVIAGLLVLFAVVIGALRKGDLSLSGILTHAGIVSFVNLLNLEYILNTFPASKPFAYGSTYFMNIMLIRPGPDIDFTRWLTEQLGLIHFEGGTTPSIIGEWYLNFGYFGIVGMFLLGNFSALLHKKLSSCSNIFEIVKWTFISVAFLKVITGGISNVIINLVVNLIVLEVIVLSSKVSIFKRGRVVE